jgi:hypothetical protein
VGKLNEGKKLAVLTRSRDVLIQIITAQSRGGAGEGRGASIQKHRYCVFSDELPTAFTGDFRRFIFL